MQIGTRKKRKITLNIISLIDVVLLLLIFFMLTTRFMENPGMKLDLPGSKSAEKTRLQDLEISVEPTGKIFLNNNEVMIEELADRLAESIPQSSEKSLILRADKNVTHGTVVEIMDIARTIGIEKIVIATREK